MNVVAGTHTTKPDPDGALMSNVYQRYGWTLESACFESKLNKQTNISVAKI